MPAAHAVPRTGPRAGEQAGLEFQNDRARPRAGIQGAAEEAFGHGRGGRRGAEVVRWDARGRGENRRDETVLRQAVAEAKNRAARRAVLPRFRGINPRETDWISTPSVGPANNRVLHDADQCDHAQHAQREPRSTPPAWATRLPSTECGNDRPGAPRMRAAATSYRSQAI